MTQMHDKHPGLVKFRAAKEKRRATATLTSEVAKWHPTYSLAKCRSIAEASIKAQQRVRSNNRKRN